MKRIIYSFLFLVLTIVSALPAYGLEIAKCLLQHNGNVTTYDASKLPDAIKASADGDTIFLTAGTFPGFTLDKKVTVRGVGDDKSKITGDVSIAIPGTPTIDQTILEGIYFGSGTTVKCTTAMNGLKIKQCQMQDLDFAANNDQVILDRCAVNNELKYSKYIKGLTAIGSFIRLGISTSSTDCPAYFMNCHIYSYFIDWVSGNFVNCTLYGKIYQRYDYYRNCNFTNCYRYYFRKIDDTCYEQNCWSNSSDTGCTPEFLEENQMFGTDGTIIGHYGGQNPYTMTLAIPKVTEQTISLDTETKVLNVNIKVSAD